MEDSEGEVFTLEVFICGMYVGILPYKTLKIQHEVGGCLGCSMLKRVHKTAMEIAILPFYAVILSVKHSILFIHFQTSIIKFLR